MTPEELREMQEQLAALKNGIEMVAGMIADVGLKIDASHAQVAEQADTMQLIATELIGLGESLPRIGDKLADLARELRDGAELSKKKPLWARG